MYMCMYMYMYMYMHMHISVYRVAPMRTFISNYFYFFAAAITALQLHPSFMASYVPPLFGLPKVTTLQGHTRDVLSISFDPEDSLNRGRLETYGNLLLLKVAQRFLVLSTLAGPYTLERWWWRQAHCMESHYLWATSRANGDLPAWTWTTISARSELFRFSLQMLGIKGFNLLDWISMKVLQISGLLSCTWFLMDVGPSPFSDFSEEPTAKWCAISSIAQDTLTICNWWWKSNMHTSWAHDFIWLCHHTATCSNIQ